MYTVLMWDPDAVVPSYIHTLIINISKKSDGTIILPHTPPSPPPGTGRHRYITGFFKQPGPISIRSMKRSGFNVDRFVKKHGLDLVNHKMFTVNS